MRAALKVFKEKERQKEVKRGQDAIRKTEEQGGKKGGKGDKSKGKGRGASAGSETCTCCGLSGHTKKDCRFKDQECHNCHKVGHLARTCR